MWTPLDMKTGGRSVATTEPTLDETAIKQRVHAILTTFMKRAIEVGGQYAKAAGRDNLSSMDVVYALQYQAHTFIEEMDNDNMEQVFDENLPQSQEENDEDDTDDDEDTEDEDDTDDVFSRCEDPTDPIIIKMNAYHDDWDAWEPSNAIQQMLKNAIDKIPL